MSVLGANGLNTVYFDTFNNYYPLYSRSVFDNYLERQYSSNPPDIIAWYTSLNLVIAIGILTKQMHIFETNTVGNRGPSYEISWKYFRNATGTFTELLFTDVSLIRVGTLIGMVRFSDEKGL
jgi:hypothetical protein